MARAVLELKLLYANSVWIIKNNLKANIWKLYMNFEANKEFMENLSLQTWFLVFKILSCSHNLDRGPFWYQPMADRATLPK